MRAWSAQGTSYIAKIAILKYLFCLQKCLIISIFLAKNLHMSKKSSTFALENKTKAASQPYRISDCKKTNLKKSKV